MTEEVEECRLEDKLAGILRHGGGAQTSIISSHKTIKTTSMTARQPRYWSGEKEQSGNKRKRS